MSWYGYDDGNALERQREELEEKRAVIGEIAAKMQAMREGLLTEVKEIAKMVQDNDLQTMTGIEFWGNPEEIDVDDYRFEEIVRQTFDRWSVMDTAEQWAASNHNC